LAGALARQEELCESAQGQQKSIQNLTTSDPDALERNGYRAISGGES
jgi:hypothetical protein